MSDDIVDRLPSIGLHILENTLAGVVGVIAAPAEPFVQVVTGQSVSDLARRLEGALIAEWGLDQDQAKDLCANHPALSAPDDNIADKLNAAELIGLNEAEPKKPRRKAAAA